MASHRRVVETPEVPVRRLFRGVAITVGLFLVVVLALGDGATIAVASAGLVAAGFVWWVRRSRDGALTILSLLFACLVTSWVTQVAGAALGADAPLWLGTVFWTFLGVLTLMVWLPPHSGMGRSRGRLPTVVGAHALLVVTSLLSALAPSVVPVAGFAVAVVFVVLRSRGRLTLRRPTVRQVPLDTRTVALAARGADRTATTLASLPGDWTAAGGLALPGGLVAEHLVAGPGGVYVVESRSWEGSLALTSVDQDSGPVEAYGLDGDAAELAARLRPVGELLEAAEDVPWLRDADLAVVLAVWGTARPGAPLEIALVGRRDHATRAVVHLVAGDQVADWLRARPQTAYPGAVTRVAAHLSRLRARGHQEAPDRLAPGGLRGLQR
ncbi:NERD domain-containing protein [Actinopolymorpha cephalotaxi]|uniref:NERD domain-containing protein n=1 Tax=Actinopolymorpha cephalotaxi TaxID=504797 RepID=UPI00111474E0|nr:NERD domain-containing protein [Actinopolymorpha cephalotaxi]